MMRLFLVYVCWLGVMSTTVIGLTGFFPVLHHHRVGGGAVGCGMTHGFAKCMGGYGHLLKVYDSKESNTLEGEEGSVKGEEEEEFSLLDPRVVEARRTAIGSPQMKVLLKTIGCIDDADIEEEANTWKTKKVHPPQWPPKKRRPPFSVDGRSEESILRSLIMKSEDSTTEPPSPVGENGQTQTDPVLSQPNPQDPPPKE